MEDAMSSADQGAPGAWIFLSHSHLDLVKVRRIRDAFEARAHNPLMFFLKALDDGSELDDLIGVRSKLEHGSSSAKARMRAPHAGWQQEVEIITSLDGKCTRSSISTTISKRRWSGSWFAASFGTGAFLEQDTERERAAGEPPSEPKAAPLAEGERVVTARAIAAATTCVPLALLHEPSNETSSTGRDSGSRRG
jgi:hypothetical protein